MKTSRKWSMTPVPPMMLLAAWRGAAAAALTSRARQFGPGLRACRARCQEAPAALRPGAQACGVARACFAKALAAEQLLSQRVCGTCLRRRPRRRCLRPFLLPAQLDDRRGNRNSDERDCADASEGLGVHECPRQLLLPGNMLALPG